ncbi:MAG: hypothetical protein ACLVCH_04195 [Roseburia inulinivorans]
MPGRRAVISPIRESLHHIERWSIAEYTFLGGGCDDCLALNGHDFPVDEAEPGLNLPPIHPNCKCTTVAKTGIDLFKDREGVNPLKDNPKFEEWKKKYVKEQGLSATVGGAEGVPEHEEKKSCLNRLTSRIQN